MVCCICFGLSSLSTVCLSPISSVSARDVTFHTCAHQFPVCPLGKGHPDRLQTPLTTKDTAASTLTEAPFQPGAEGCSTAGAVFAQELSRRLPWSTLLPAVHGGSYRPHDPRIWCYLDGPPTSVSLKDVSCLFHITHPCGLMGGTYLHLPVSLSGFSGIRWPITCVAPLPTGSLCSHNSHAGVPTMPVPCPSWVLENLYLQLLLHIQLWH